MHMNEPIRVAHVIGKMVGGGVEAVIMNFYRCLDRSQVQFDFIIDSDSTVVPAEEIGDLGGRVFEVPPYQHLGEYRKGLGDLLVRNGYDIVHSHINSLSVFPLGTAKRAGVPARIAHSHSTTGKGEFLRNAVKLALRTQANRYPTVRLACTEHAGEWLFGNAPFEVLPNPIDFKRFAFDPEARAEMRGAWGVADDELVIGHVGRWTSQKNQIYLLHILRGLLDFGVSARLVLVGDGPDRAAIEVQMGRLGLADRVIAPGCVDSAKAYSGFDVFCFPSRYEGLGMAPMEARASGLPCLVSDAVPAEIDLMGDVRFLPLAETGVWVDSIRALAADGSLVSRDRSVDFGSSSFRRHDPDLIAGRLQDMYLRLESEVRR